MAHVDVPVAVTLHFIQGDSSVVGDDLSLGRLQVIVGVVDSTTHEAILKGALVILPLSVVRLAFSLFQTVLGMERTLQRVGWGRISVLLLERVDKLIGIEFHLLLLLFGFFTLKT